MIALFTVCHSNFAMPGEKLADLMRDFRREIKLRYSSELQYMADESTSFSLLSVFCCREIIRPGMLS
jgi:hypothetical protein